MGYFFQNSLRNLIIGPILVPLKSDFCEFFQIFKIIILGHDFFLNSYIFEGPSQSRGIKHRKVSVFYDRFNEICIIFLFLLQSLFSADKNIYIFF